MNDFTKEELEELRASRCYHLDDSFPADDKLFMKIQSMIDNYCDHEWRCWDDQHNTRVCMKCAEKREGEI